MSIATLLGLMHLSAQSKASSNEASRFFQCKKILGDAGGLTHKHKLWKARYLELQLLSGANLSNQWALELLKACPGLYVLF